MVGVADLENIISTFKFTKGDYVGAEKQLSSFANCFAQLSREEVDYLRSRFDAKERNNWFRIASSLVSKSYEIGGKNQKEQLCNIFFAFYCFESLDFGYDALMDVSKISEILRKDPEISKSSWIKFKRLCANDLAKTNLEKKMWG